MNLSGQNPPKIEENRRQKILDLNGERGKNDASFRICRRKHLVDPSRIADWDGTDQCKICGIDVLYDRKDSEGVPHICVQCADLNFRALGLGALNPSPIDDSQLSNEESIARIALSISQSKHGEHKIV